MKRFMKSVLIAVAIFTAAAGSANADPVTAIDFLGAGGGTINIGTNITGVNIFIDAVTIAGAPVGNGFYNVDGAGACARDLLGGCGLLNFDRNANTISLVGSIPALGITSQTLLSGNFTGGGVTVLINDGTTGSVELSGHDTKSPALLFAIGLDPATPFNLFGTTIGVNFNQQGSPYTAMSTDILNTTVSGAGGSGQTLVPEPGSLMLFGTGLLGLAGRLRRRYSKKD